MPSFGYGQDSFSRRFFQQLLFYGKRGFAQLAAGLVEKPSFNMAPSNLASIGRYVLTPDIFDLLRDLPPGSGGEIQLADAINMQAAQGRVDSVKLEGTRYDCGSVDGYLDAITAVAAKRRAG